MKVNSTPESLGPYGIFDEATEAAIEQAIIKALPVDNEQIYYIGNEPVFAMCQHLKGVMPQDGTFAQLRPFVQLWYEWSKDKLLDDCGDQITFADAWAMVIEVWHKVKYAKGCALDNAQTRARAATYMIPELSWCDDEKMLFLARVCYELSLPDGDFFLSTYDAGDILGKSQKKGRNALKMFEAERIIERTKVGHTGVASEYKYVGRAVVEGGKKMRCQKAF